MGIGCTPWRGGGAPPPLPMHPWGEETPSRPMLHVMVGLLERRWLLESDGRLEEIRRWLVGRRWRPGNRRRRREGHRVRSISMGFIPLPRQVLGCTLQEEGGYPPLIPPFPDQSEHRGKQRNLPPGKCDRAIFGTHTFGSQTPPLSRVALKGKGPRRQSQKRLDRRLQDVSKAVGGGYCRLQLPLRLALNVRGTVPGHRLGALKGGW